MKNGFSDCVHAAGTSKDPIIRFSRTSEYTASTPKVWLSSAQKQTEHKNNGMKAMTFLRSCSVVRVEKMKVINCTTAMLIVITLTDLLLST